MQTNFKTLPFHVSLKLLPAVHSALSLGVCCHVSQSIYQILVLGKSRRGRIGLSFASIYSLSSDPFFNLYNFLLHKKLFSISYKLRSACNQLTCLRICLDFDGCFLSSLLFFTGDVIFKTFVIFKNLVLEILIYNCIIYSFPFLLPNPPIYSSLPSTKFMTSFLKLIPISCSYVYVYNSNLLSLLCYLYVCANECIFVFLVLFL